MNLPKTSTAKPVQDKILVITFKHSTTASHTSLNPLSCKRAPALELYHRVFFITVYSSKNLGIMDTAGLVCFRVDSMSSER